MNRSWLLLMFVAASACAQEVVDKERYVKAAYLYNFGIYTKWPRDVDRFRIAVLGKEDLGDALAALVETKKTIQNKPIEILRFEKPEDVTDCEILLLKSGEHLDRVLTITQARGVLIVTEEPGLAERGAMINFVLEDGKVKFEINRRALDRENLRVDYRVLNLGKIVGEPKPSSTAVSAP